MLGYHVKGERRVRLDRVRREAGEPRANWLKNRTLNCRFEKDSKAYRKKGRNRFKTGKKRQKKGKSSL